MVSATKAEATKTVSEIIPKKPLSYANASLKWATHNCRATPLKIDNVTAHKIFTGTKKQKQSKAIDTRFYWLKDCTTQGKFKSFWELGKHNLADYPTKYHSGAYHEAVRPMYRYNTKKSSQTF